MEKFLTKAERKELLEELKNERYRRYEDRIRVILLLDDDWTYKKISKAFFLDEGSISNYKKRYKKYGFEGLINDSYQGKGSFLAPNELKRLEQDLSKIIFPNTKAVIAHIKAKYHVAYSRTGATDLLHKLGFSFKKATAVPGKAIKKDQKKFVRRYKRLRKSYRIYFADSTHPEYQPTITYGWIKKGEKFEVKTNSGWKKRVNICGAIGIENLDIITRTHKTINKTSICDLLRQIRRKNLDEKKLCLILDGAAYNRAKVVKKLAKKLKIKLVYLPAYSPNLNPIERLWKFMKAKVTANRYYEKFDQFKDSLTQFFRGIRKYKLELETLITDKFPILGT